MEENNNLVQFIFNQNREVIAEQETTWTSYIRGSTLLASSADHARTYYHFASDEMSSVTHIVDDEKVLNEYEYDAWGEVVKSVETVKNRFKFNGQQLDPITQQYYLRARFYNPVIARFTQEDTYRGDGLNLYAYCRNNPTYYVDPTGNARNCVKEAYDEIRAANPGMSALDAHALAMTQARDNQPSNPQADMPNSDSQRDVNTETYYRTMSQEHYDILRITGEVQPTGETFISPTQSFSEDYYGVLVKIEVIQGTTSQLESVGVRDGSNSTAKTYPDMPKCSEGWTLDSAYFKTENGQINIGLGRGSALEIFNTNIVSHERMN